MKTISLKLSKTELQETAGKSWEQLMYLFPKALAKLETTKEKWVINEFHNDIVERQRNANYGTPYPANPLAEISRLAYFQCVDIEIIKNKAFFDLYLMHQEKKQRVGKTRGTRKKNNRI